MHNINTFDNTEVEKYLNLSREYYSDFVDSETKFSLFVQDEELVRLISELKIQTIQLVEPHHSKCGFAILKNNGQIDLMEKTIPLIDQPEKRKELYEIRSEIKEEYRRQLTANYKTLFPITHRFQKLSRNYIYKIIETN